MACHRGGILYSPPPPPAPPAASLKGTDPIFHRPTCMFGFWALRSTSAKPGRFCKSNTKGVLSSWTRSSGWSDANWFLATCWAGQRRFCRCGTACPFCLRLQIGFDRCISSSLAEGTSDEEEIWQLNVANEVSIPSLVSHDGLDLASLLASAFQRHDRRAYLRAPCTHA